MFSFTIWTVLRIIYSLIFTICCSYISNFINKIEEKKKCPLSEGWRITNGKIISSILIIIGSINIIIPINKFLSTLPIIGSSYILLFVILIFTLLFILNRLSVNIAEREDSKCNIKGYDYIINFFQDRTVLECIYMTILITVIFFYL